ncbi:site-specific integrase [Phreatobacter sp.]|uniref:site-specific integrase n=1 Tax=Phreatobacter sp. TaxID=1966341 RepID=UPI003F72D2D0
MVTIAVRYRYLVEETDRHGNRRLYVRFGQGPRKRLREEPGTEAFRAEYEAAVAWLRSGAPRADDGRPKLARAVPGSFRAAWMAYQASAEWKAFDPETQKARRRLFEAMCLEPLDRDNPDLLMADCPVARISRKHVTMLRDRRASAPEQANHRLKALRPFFAWLGRAWDLPQDPSEGVAKFRRESTGHHTWTEDEFGQFLAAHGEGTQARLAFALALFTGLRVSDLSRAGPQHVRGGRLLLTLHKNRNVRPVQLDIPVHPALAAVIGQSKVGNLAFLVTAFGRPFTAKGLSNKFKDWCIAAGLRHCTAHGIRKGSATLVAEASGSEHALMALYGWTDPKQAGRYTRAARKKRLADDAVARLSENKIPHLFGVVPEREGKPTRKPRKTNDG